MTVNVGTTFNSSYADANPTWTVVKARGAGTWDCVIKDDLDYAGTQKVFGTEEILRSRNVAAVFEQLTNDNDTFWNSRPIGAVVHYSNGFGEYVRGIVVIDLKDNSPTMMPTGLVGNWRPNELPRFHPISGEAIIPHHAKGILEQKTFRPHATNIFESDPASFLKRYAEVGDPGRLVPININLPVASSEQVRNKRIVEARREAVRIMSDLSIPVDKALAKAQNLLAEFV